jgi:hypothetical protein
MKSISLLAALVAALLLGAGASASVERGKIVVDRGAAGITLGISRPQVVAALGKPLYENDHGYMQYSDRSLFDVYRSDSRNGRVDLIAISGPSFCLRNGICMLRRGNVAALERKFGRRLTFHVLADGTLCYRVSGSFRGRRSYTQFDVENRSDSARIILIWLGWKR